MRERISTVIFGTTTRAGRLFDLLLLVFILVSVIIVMLESIPGWRANHLNFLYFAEWGFTILFSVEYLLRVYSAPNRWGYIKSWWGLIDLISILPTFISLLVVPNYAAFRVIRAFRLLRIFRILKLSRFTSESQALAHSLKASYYKIMVFFFFVLLMMILSGTIMYVIEGGENGFDSIPSSIYWAIVTTTTVGYGDIAPVTPLGKMLASVMMITGYAIIAVPTGLITIGMSRYKSDGAKDNLCSVCEHDNPFGSVYCNQCGNEMLEN